MVGAMARVSQDVLPYTIVEGHPAVTRSVNSIGMQRRGFSEEDLKAVRMCYKKLFVNKKLTVHEALEELRHSGYAENACLRRIIQFVETSERGSAIESMKTGFVFDLDGTLVDSIPGIARGLNLALKALGYPEHSVDAIREMVGKGVRELPGFPEGYFNGNVPEEAFEAVHQGFMREYPHTWQEGTVPYPGIREMLLSLAGEGYPLGVLSNKPHAVTVPLVRHILPEIPSGR